MEKEMQNFLATQGRTSGVAAIVALPTLIVVAVASAIVISGLVGRVERLESEIKLLRSDLDHPRARPLASIFDTGAGLRQ
jgi:hypothetical protein